MINIEWENSPNTVEVIGTDGKVYLTERVVNGVNSINVANLAAGNYIARIRGEEGWVAQIVKY